MKQRKAKRGFTVLLMVGIIFAAIGIGYLITVAALFCTMKVRRGESAFLMLNFGIMGVIFLFVGGICFAVEIKKQIRATRMRNAGRYVTAEITEISICNGIRINRRHPYVVVCSYQDMEGNIHQFKSRYLYFNPEPLLKDRYVRVYVDEENFRHYYVDIDEVLPNVVGH